MAQRFSLSATIVPEVDERAAQREGKQLGDTLAAETGDIPVDVDPDVGSIGSLGGDIGGGRGGDSTAIDKTMLAIQERTLKHQRSSAEEDIERNQILTRMHEMLESGFTTGGGDGDDAGGVGALGGAGRGGGGLGTAGAAAGGAGLLRGAGGAAAGAVLPVALAGATAFGILQGIQKLSRASPALAQTNEMFKESMSLFIRPFGNFLSGILRPWATAALGMAVRFNELYAEEGLKVALGTIADDAEESLAASVGETVTNGLEDVGLGSDLAGHAGEWIEDGFRNVDWGQAFKGGNVSFVFEVAEGVAETILEKLFGDTNIRARNIGDWVFGGVFILGDMVLDWLFGGISITGDNLLSWTFGDIGIDGGDILEYLFGGISISEGDVIGSVTGGGLGGNGGNGGDTTPTEDTSGSDAPYEDIAGTVDDPVPVGGGGGGGSPGDTVDDPFQFAAGGIVRSPTRGTVGEAGPEAVMPLSDLSREIQRALRQGMAAARGGGGDGAGMAQLRSEIQSLRRAIQNLTVENELVVDGKRLATTTEQASDRFNSSREVLK